MTIYKTQDGDTLDWICDRNYGRTSGAVEAVLEANPGLAELGPIYDAGRSISLPDLPAAQQQDLIRLWD
jgi:phage tail protein X